MSFFESDDENFNPDNPDEDTGYSNLNNDFDDSTDEIQLRNQINPDKLIINEIQFDEWHKNTNCSDFEDQQIVLDEVIENMICYIMKSICSQSGRYPYSYREHLEEICGRGYITINTMEMAINVIEQLNETNRKLDEKIKIIQEFTGHTPTQITDFVYRAWNPTRRDKYDPDLIGMPTKLYNTHLLEKIGTPLESKGDSNY